MHVSDSTGASCVGSPPLDTAVRRWPMPAIFDPPGSLHLAPSCRSTPSSFSLRRTAAPCTTLLHLCTAWAHAALGLRPVRVFLTSPSYPLATRLSVWRRGSKRQRRQAAAAVRSAGTPRGGKGVTMGLALLAYPYMVGYVPLLAPELALAGGRKPWH